MRGCWQALNHASTVPVTKHRQLARLKTTFGDEKFFLIAIKKLRLKRSLSWGYKLRKRIVLVLLTTVDLRITFCVTRQYLFRIHFFASQRLSESPAYLYNYIYLLLSSFFFSLDQDYLRPSITWQKERACNVLISEFPAPSRQFTYILNNFRLSKREERMNKNKPKRRSRVDQKSAEIKLAPFSVGKLPFLHAYFTWQKPGNSTNLFNLI